MLRRHAAMLSRRYADMPPRYHAIRLILAARRAAVYFRYAAA